MRHIVIGGLSDSTVFFYIVPQMAHFFGMGWGKLLNIKCVFWFSLQLLSETFLILIRIHRDIIINVHLSSCKVSVILVRF